MEPKTRNPTLEERIKFGREVTRQLYGEGTPEELQARALKASQESRARTEAERGPNYVPKPADFRPASERANEES